MKRHWMMRVLKFLAFATVAVTVLGFVVMSLWNWLLPGLFGWKLIGSRQAVGLVILSKILFGGLRAHPGRRIFCRRRMMERWAQMSPQGARNIPRRTPGALRALRTAIAQANRLTWSAATRSHHDHAFAVSAAHGFGTRGAPNLARIELTLTDRRAESLASG